MWNFKVIEVGIPERNPRETEFFRIRSPAESVIREFIQNSIDAKKNNEEPVKVRVSLIHTRKDNVNYFFDNALKKHLIACDMIAHGDYPENFSNLVLEDFGTTGLDGPIKPDARSGNFYNFWWREGISQKTARKAGRWGLGKLTFHIVSRIRTFFGLTVRNDGEIFLMGKALLKTHILDDKRYHYFGYFSEDNYTPIRDSSIISQFKKTFEIRRDYTKTGLSLVIPLPLDEINYESLLKGVILHYFYPILTGSLIVEIHENSKHVELNNKNLIEKALSIDWRGTDWDGINIQEILEFIRDVLPEEAYTLRISDDDNPTITEGSFVEIPLRDIKESFRLGKPLKFRIPIKIKKMDTLYEEDAFFTIILKRIRDLVKPFEYYIRSGILISDMKVVEKRPIAGLLIADDSNIAEFLGDCETPAHTFWNERTEGFKEKYFNAVKILRFIKKSMNQIVSILDEPPHERQIDFLKEIFSIPIGPEEEREEEILPEPETIREPIIPPIMGKSQMFNVFKISEGFGITLNPQIVNECSFPFNATVRIAYDTLGGNPFNKYEKFDFDVASNSIIINTQDCNVLIRKLNKIEIEITGPNFKLEVSGFDPNRDLVIDVKEAAK